MSPHRRTALMVGIILTSASIVVVQAARHDLPVFGNDELSETEFVDPTLQAGFQPALPPGLAEFEPPTAEPEPVEEDPVDPWKAYALERLDPRWMTRQRGQALAALHLAPDPFAPRTPAVEVPEPAAPVPRVADPAVEPAARVARPGRPPVRVTATLVGDSGNLAIIDGLIFREGDPVQTREGLYRVARIRPREVLLEAAGVTVAIPVQEPVPPTVPGGHPRSPAVQPDLEIDH